MYKLVCLWAPKLPIMWNVFDNPDHIMNSANKRYVHVRAWTFMSCHVKYLLRNDYSDVIAAAKVIGPSVNIVRICLELESSDNIVNYSPDSVCCKVSRFGI